MKSQKGKTKGKFAGAATGDITNRAEGKAKV